MTQIQLLVNDYIEKNIDVKRAIKHEIVSLRKLARFIAKEIDTDKLDAVLSAIRRYEIKDESKDAYEVAKKIVSNTKISTKSNIISIAVEKSEYSTKILQKLFDVVNYNKGEVLRIIQAEEAIKLIIDERNYSKIEKIIDKKNIIKIEKNLAEINLRLDKLAVSTPGIISVIFSELMINNININEAMSCVPEMLLFVKEKNLLKTYSILYNLVKGE